MKHLSFSIIIFLLLSFQLSCNKSGSKDKLASTLDQTTNYESEDKPAKYAFLVGINEYEFVTNLYGCKNDISLMKNLLINKFGFKDTDIKTLINEEATRENILNGFKNYLLANIKENDIVVFHYSGHGAQIKNLSSSDSTEIDKLEEILVCHDFEDSPNKPFKGILDDEVNGLLKRLSEVTENVTFILDACNSAGVSKSFNSVRRIEAQPRRFDNIEDFAVDTRSLWSDETKYAFLTACKSNEFAYEMKAPNDSVVGAFTYYLTQELSKNKGLFSYEDIFGSVIVKVKSNNRFQYPELYGTETNKQVFGVADLNPVSYALITKQDGNKVELNVGATVGITIDSEFEVYAPQVDLRLKNKSPLGTVKIAKVYPTHSEAIIVGNHSIEVLNSKAVETKHSFKGIDLKVYLDGEWSENRNIIKKVEELDYASITKNKNLSDIILKNGGDEIEFYLSNNLENPKKKFLLDTEKSNLINYLEEWASWVSAVKINNPKSNLNIEVELISDIEGSGSKGLIDYLNNPEHTLIHGQPFDLIITNKSDKPVYIHILNIIDTPEIASLCLAEFQDGVETLAPDQSIPIELVADLDENIDRTTDILKVIASIDGEFDLNYLTLGCSDSNSKNVKPRKKGRYDVNSWIAVDKIFEVKRN